jgi:hypothetical protein
MPSLLADHLWWPLGCNLRKSQESKLQKSNSSRLSPWSVCGPVKKQNLISRRLGDLSLSLKKLLSSLLDFIARDLQSEPQGRLIKEKSPKSLISPYIFKNNPLSQSSKI